MSILTKAYWKSKNYIEAKLTVARNTEQVPLGCLSQREDKRDLGVFGLFETKPKYKSYTKSVPKWVHNQNPFNICTFDGTAIGYSLQEGIRFSVESLVGYGKRAGIITGNGFCYQRGPMDMAVKYGFLPYELMPDEIRGRNWQEYSSFKMTPGMEAVARQYRPASYRRIGNANEAVAAIEAGYVLITANDWYQGMNRPTSPDYLLLRTGQYIGGHQWCAPGYRADGKMVTDWASHQSFGPNYGLKGLARIKNLFMKGQFDVYLMEKLAGRTDEQRALGTFDGYAIKGPKSSAVYYISGGEKHLIPNEPIFKKRFGGIYYLLDQKLIDNLPEGTPIFE